MKIHNKINLIAVEHPLAAELSTEIGKILLPETLVVHENSPEVTMLTKALVAVANQAWRIAGAVINQDSKEPKSELSTQEIKKVGNALGSIKESLAELGIKVHDRVGEPFNAGLPEEIVTEEPMEGITEDRIIKTYKPTIMWNQTMVQRGAIDIAFPKK